MRANSDMPIVIRQGGIVTADSERRNHIVRELVLSGKLKALTLYREQRKVLFSAKMTPISAAIQ